MSLNLSQGDIVAYTKELTSAFDSSAKTKGIELKVGSSQSKIKAFIDPEKMEKIILNLLSNAVIDQILAQDHPSAEYLIPFQRGEHHPPWAQARSMTIDGVAHPAVRSAEEP
jgi:hypothetical protein